VHECFIAASLVQGFSANRLLMNTWHNMGQANVKYHRSRIKKELVSTKKVFNKVFNCEF